MDQKKIKSNLQFIKNNLGLLFNKNSENKFFIKSEEKEVIEDLIKERNNARIDKDFEKADKLRKKLEILGVEISDTKNDTNWKKLNRNVRNILIYLVKIYLIYYFSFFS